MSSQHDIHHHTTPLDWPHIRAAVRDVFDTATAAGYSEAAALEAATRELLTENARHGFHRCYGQLFVSKIDALPTLGKCTRLECHKCGKDIRAAHKDRIFQTAHDIHTAGKPLYFITLYYTSASVSTRTAAELTTYRDSVKRVFSTNTRRARRDGVTVRYMYVHGFKKSTRQAHAHGLADYLPDATPAPTLTHPHRVTSAALDAVAAKHGLTVWIETVHSPGRVSGYIAEHLTPPPYDVELPRHFHRAVYGKNWTAVDKPQAVPDGLLTMARVELGATVRRAGDIGSRKPDRVDVETYPQLIEVKAELEEKRGYSALQNIGVTVTNRYGGCVTTPPSWKHIRKPHTLDVHYPPIWTRMVDVCRVASRVHENKKPMFQTIGTDTRKYRRYATARRTEPP